MKKFGFKKILSLILIAAMIMTFAACGKKTSESAGTKHFTFIAVDKEGAETKWDISTEETIVGDALTDEGLIEGEEGAYGLYVKKVNGIEAIYEVDGTYWSFYIDGEYAMTGVDATEIVDGSTYMFKVEGQ